MKFFKLLHIIAFDYIIRIEIIFFLKRSYPSHDLYMSVLFSLTFGFHVRETKKLFALKLLLK
jgi:hypothetical protein